MARTLHIGRTQGGPPLKVSRYRSRSRRGDLIAEAVIVLAILFPTVVLTIYMSLEASQAYVIARAMHEAADLAARELASEYHSSPGIVSSDPAQQAVFTNIRTPNMVSTNSQFSIPTNGWNTSGTPPTVTVTVKYLSGQGTPALPSFPSPDPLKLGSLFVVQSSAIYRLQ